MSVAIELPAQAYEALSNYFKAHEKQILQIEVLPRSIKPPDGVLMVDGTNVGIPKKTLTLAFIEARKRFFNDDPQPLRLNATKIILLFDPEHLTAANYRKQHLTTLKGDTSQEGQLAYRKAVKYEFCFLDSILTSPLHRQSKSPTLWQHRLWLLKLLVPKDKESVSEESRKEFWRKELDAVFRSGESHPKNYYAWQYARRLEERIDVLDATLNFAQCIKAWCCKHPSDISGWSCLLYLVPKIEPPSERHDLVWEVLKYAIDLQAEQESLWVFIRTVLAHEAMQEWRTELVSLLEDYCKDLERTEHLHSRHKLVTRSLAWVTSHSGSIEIPEQMESS